MPFYVFGKKFPLILLLLISILLRVVCLQAEEFGLEYEIDFQGIEDRSLKKDIQKVSDCFAKRKERVSSRMLLKKRAERDLNKIVEVLRARGYYGAKAEFELKSREKGISLDFRISPGEVYRIGEVSIKTDPGLKDINLSLSKPEDLGLDPDQAVLAEEMVQAGQRLSSFLKNKGYVFVQTKKPKVYPDPDKKQVRLVLKAKLGPKTSFGRTELLGLKRVDPEYVREKIPWSKGQVYSSKLLSQARNRLMSTGLFSLVKIKHESELNEKGLLPMEIEFRESKPKKISLGAGYSTDLGPGTEASWEHSNVFGRAETLRFSLKASQVRQIFETKMKKPEFLSKEQSLTFSSALEHEDLEAYTKTGGRFSFGVDRILTNHLQVGLGLGYKGSSIEEAEEEEVFHLANLKGYLDWDNREDILNPEKGKHLRLKLEPFQSFSDLGLFFFKTAVTGKHYLSLNEKKGLVWANRVKLANVWGSSQGDIPADERQYAGGGGSVRGYPYKELGPQKDGDPYGGRAKLEASSELRFKASSSLGGCLFLDAGNAYESSWPDPGDKFYWGTGAGLRYFTAVGPIRLDLAFPLNRPDYIEDSWQLYISIGQSF